MQKVLITGSNGLLGQSLVNLLLLEKEKYQVYGVSKGENRAKRTDFSYHDLDLTQENDVKQLLKSIAPDVIVNTAAMTQVDLCEDHRELCNKINVEFVDVLKNYSEQNNTHLIHLSTDFVFDGKKGNYKETDSPNPVSFYGNSKLKAEQLLIQSTVKYTIIRTILVFGKVHDMSRTNIVLWVKEMLENKNEITIVDDQFRMPTYVEDLALACKLSIDKKATGIYHISSNTLLSVYNIAKQIAETFNLDTTLLKPISSKALNQRARRPPKTGFDLSKSIQQLNFPSVSFAESLQRFKETLN